MNDQRLVSTWWATNANLDSGLELLQRLGMDGFKQKVFASCAAALGVIALCALTSPVGEIAEYGRVGLIAAVPVSFVMSIRYWFGRSPGRPEMLIVIAAVDVLVSLGCLGHHNPIAGVASGTLFVMMSSLCLFYSTPRQHIFHALFGSGVILSIVIAASIRHAGLDEISMLLSKAIGPLVMLFVFPFLQFCTWMLTTNAVAAYSDPLTRLTNRRGIENFSKFLTLPSDTATAVVVDIDDFKSINDTYGHSVGDAVLTSVGRQLTLVADHHFGEKRAIVARTGGEEFAIIGAAADADGLPEAIRQVVTANTDPAVTVSVGVATGQISSDSDVEKLLRAADAAMYSVKHTGGDGVARSV